jgi:hypothetical protein
MKKQKVLSSETQYHLLPSDQETITLLAIATANHDNPRLKALAQTINERYRASQDRDTASLDDALIMGSCFNEAKALKKGQKGEFGKWCRINCSVNDTQRRIYQRLDRNRDLIADQINTGVVSSIKGALRLISQISQKSKGSKKPTNKLIGRVTLPFSDIEVSKDSKDKKNPYYCLIFRTTKRQDVANTYKAITGNDLPPDPPDEEPAEKIESVEEPTELAELTV